MTSEKPLLENELMFDIQSSSTRVMLESKVDTVGNLLSKETNLDRAKVAYHQCLAC